MSNLLKSKFLLGVVTVAIMFAGFVAVSNSASASTCTISTTLRVGSRGSQVACLQASLDNGIVADGIFGPKTKARVMAWQASVGLVADGIFGPKSRAAWVANGAVSGNFPAGCQSASGFSPTTGLPCSSGPSTGLPAGCSTTAGFSATTGQPCNGGVTVNNGPVAVSLASNNPASGTLVAGQATADLAHFTFTGSGTVTGVTLQRLGVSADSTLSNVYLFNGATRLTDAASVSNNGMVSFNVPSGIFNGSTTISVRSDIASGTSGQTVGVMLATFTTASGTVNANLSGNIFTIASASLASISAGTVTPSGATLNPGPAVTVWQSTLNVSTRDVWMKRFSLRNVGSAPANSFANFKLFVNGVQVGTATGVDVNGYVTFDLNATPVLLASGSRVVRVDADIVSGASRTVQFSLRQASDVDFVDSSFGVNIVPTGTPWTAASVNTISGATGGTLTLEKDVSSPSTNVTLGGNDVNLATFKATAYGEPIKIETLPAGFTFTDGGAANAAATLRNGRIMISTDGTNWVQYGSTATLVPAGTSYTLNYTVMPGTPIWIQEHADIFDNDGTGTLDTSDTILGKLVAGSQNADRVDSLGSFSTAAVSGNTLAIASASITLTKNGTYANQTTTLPATNFKIASFNLAGSSVEDVLLTTLSLDVAASSGVNFTAGDLTNLYPVVKNSAGVIVAQPAPIATVAATDNNFSINYTLAKNQNLTIEFYANLADNSLPGAIVATNAFSTVLQVSGTSLVSGQTVTGGDGTTTVAGQAIAYGAASITASKDASSPVAGIVYDNQTVTSLTVKLAAVTAPYRVTDVTVTLPAAGATVAQTVGLYDHVTGALVGSAPGGSTSVTFSGLTFDVPANTNKYLDVKLVLGTIGVGGGTTGASILTTVTAFTAVNTSTGVSAVGTGTAAGSALNAFAAVPVVSQVALASNSLLNTTARPLLRFSMAGTGGDVAWNLLTVKVTKDAQTTIGTNGTTGITLWDVTNGGNTSVGGTFTNGATVYGAGTCSGGGATCDISFVPSSEQTVSGTKVYELRGNVAAATTAGDFATFTIDNDSAAIVASDTSANIVTGDSDAPIVWSDLSASGHATTTADWTSDFGVKNLPVSDTLTSPL